MNERWTLERTEAVLTNGIQLEVASEPDGTYRITLCESDGWVERMGAGIGLYCRNYLTRDLSQQRFESAQAALDHVCRIHHTSVKIVDSCKQVIEPLPI